MKKLLLIFMVIVLAFSMCGCNKTEVNANSEVTLSYIYGETYVRTVLEKEEAKEIIDILDGKKYYDSGIPSCGFDVNVSFIIGDDVFAVACDGCKCIKDVSKNKYFDVTNDDMYYIISIFSKYGGYFPCV